MEKIQIVIVMYDDNSACAQLQYMMILSFLNMNCEFWCFLISKPPFAHFLYNVDLCFFMWGEWAGLRTAEWGRLQMDWSETTIVNSSLLCSTMILWTFVPRPCQKLTTIRKCLLWSIRCIQMNNNKPYVLPLQNVCFIIIIAWIQLTHFKFIHFLRNQTSQ